MKKLLFPLVFFLLLLFLQLPPSLQADDEVEMILGVFPRRNATDTHAMFQPIAEYLSVQTGIKIGLETAKDFDSFWANVEKRHYDLVHYNQYHYLRSHKGQGYRVIARNAEHGDPNSTGAIIVRKDSGSGLSSVSDLAGGKIIFGGGRDAMQSYIIASYVLKSAGLSPANYEEIFARNPSNAILAVFHHQADAAGGGGSVLSFKNINELIDTSQLTYLAKGPMLPHLPWAVKESISEEQSDKIRHVLVGMAQNETGKELLKGAQIDYLLPAEDSDYNEHRRIVEMVLGEKYY